MTWIAISIPPMLLAIAIAVLPVLLISITEARRGFESADGPATARVDTPVIKPYRPSDDGTAVTKAAA